MLQLGNLTREKLLVVEPGTFGEWGTHHFHEEPTIVGSHIEKGAAQEGLVADGGLFVRAGGGRGDKK